MSGMPLDEWKQKFTIYRMRLANRIAGRKNNRDTKEAEALPPPLSWQEWPDRLRAFPARYQRAFLDLPLTDPEHMIARESLAEALAQDVSEWSAGGASQVALVGDPGAGKSTFLNWLHKHLGGKAPVVRLRFANRPETPEVLLRELASALSLPAEAGLSEIALIEAVCAGERRVVLFDDAGRIALRVPNRSAVMRCFLHILLHTRGKVLWVAAFRTRMWDRLVYQHEIDGCFSSVHEVKFFSRSELAAALAQRMRRTGLAVAIASDDDKDRSEDRRDKAAGEKRVAASGTEQLANPEAAAVRETAEREAVEAARAAEEAAAIAESEKRLGKYFEEAHGYSDGQFPLALYYWAQRAQFDEAGQQIVVADEPRKIPDPRLPGGVQERLSLAELMVHGELSAREHAAVFQWSEPESRLLLERLASAGWLIREGEISDPYYYVSPLRHQKLGKLLESAHMLY